MTKKLKIARVATLPFFLEKQLLKQMSDLISLGYEVTAVSSTAGDWERLKKVEYLQCIKLDIARAPSPINDLISLFKLIQLFRKEKFDIIHSTTPKAGLLCAVAAKLIGVPVCIHTFTGQPWATKTGFSRRFLQLMDQLIVWLADKTYTDSFSQRDFILTNGIGSENAIKVLGKGSLAGVDLERFDPSIWKNEQTQILENLGFSSTDFIITLIGRLGVEKGVNELIEAFTRLKGKTVFSHAKLLIVGPCEENEIKTKLENLNGKNDIHYMGQTHCPERYLSISHILCLPSYREGFGTVVIEAAAMGVATIGTNITGLRDAVIDGVTGILIEPRNVDVLYKSLEVIITDESLREKLAKQAHERCIKDFNSLNVSEQLAKEYMSLYERT